MGYFHESESRKRRRSAEFSNHVDRVRVPDATYNFDGPGRGSGWRQRSLSNIDLSAQTRHSLLGKSRDYSSGLYDLYSRIENRTDYKDTYSGKAKCKGTHKNEEVVFEKLNENLENQLTGSEACSLRRTRSLAVIREETFNDLEITGVRTRRSQLIPRAKLVNRSFFRDRFKHKYREEDSGSGVDTQTSETRESDDYYSNLKRLGDDKVPVSQEWANDKSDLDSLDSDYFKNSSHQSSIEPNRSKDSPQSLYSGTYHILDVEVHNNGTHHHLGEANNSEYTDGCSNTNNGRNSVLEIGLLDEILLSEENTPHKIDTQTITLRKGGRIYHGNEHTEIVLPHDFIADKTQRVVSYDSIYLSSEGSNEHTVVNEKLEDPLPEIDVALNEEVTEVNYRNNEHIDSLYSQVNKIKPKIVSVERKKTNLTTFSDISTRGTLERLTFITTPQQNKLLKPHENLSLPHNTAVASSTPKSTTIVTTTGTASKLYTTEPFVGSIIDSHQYCSLPDVNIGKSLRASERIDTKLRLSCNIDEDNPIYDSISRFGRAHKRLRQRENCEIVVLNSISIDEQPKEAPSIEVEPPIKLQVSDVEHYYPDSIGDLSQSEQSGEKDSIESPSRDELHYERATQENQIPAIIIQTPEDVDLEEEIKRFERSEIRTGSDVVTVKVVTTNTPQIIVTDVKNQVVENNKRIVHLEHVTECDKAIDRKFELKIPDNCPKVNETGSADFNHNKLVLQKPVENTKEPPKVDISEIESVILKKTEVVSKNQEPGLLISEIQKASANLQKIQLKPSLKSQADSNKSAQELRKLFKATLEDTLKRRHRERAANTKFTAYPIRISSEENLTKINDTVEIHPTLAYKVQVKEREGKMSRPQILHVVDSKRNVCHVLPRQLTPTTPAGRITDNATMCNGHESKHQVQYETGSTRSASILSEADALQQEFQDKIESTRSYWSQLVKDQKKKRPSEQKIELEKKLKTFSERNFVTSIDEVDNTMIPDTSSIQRPTSYLGSNANTSFNDIGSVNEMESFCPSVEIIELNGEKQATIVKQNDMDNIDFDHVRYKIMRSDTFRKNILAKTKKEAQFDGLLQYLQDYSFQELLANNNVVIIEPVRTKIEKISEHPHKIHKSQICKITGGSNDQHTGKGLKTHFFYHPIRVNKELLEDELPDPDTVRNVRKLFEETMRFTTPGNSSSQRTDDNNCDSNTAKTKRKLIKNLHVDTSFGRKWDSVSLSSGVSSGNLSSPCDCNDNDENGEQKDMYSSEENLCDDMCDTYYVSQDVLEKIRECGSSVTYYGGRVVDNKSPEVNPMTKAIMQEIRGLNSKCESCQPNNCPDHETIRSKFPDQDSTAGVKFRLVKSNSCSSRLELAGTEKFDGPPKRKEQRVSPLVHYCTSPPPPTSEEAEESVRALISKLESGTTHSNRTAPRIIESRCIEKTTDKLNNPNEDDPFTINSQMTESNRLSAVELITQVTVNNHISLGASMSSLPHSTQTTKQPSTPATGTTKIRRNKNVDLAMTMTRASSDAKLSSAKEKESHIKKLPIMESSLTEMSDKITTNNNINGATNGAVVVELTATKSEVDEGLTSCVAQQNKRSEMIVELHNSENAFVKESAKSDNELIAESDATGEKPRLVKWGTWTKFDDKNYVANDIRLKQTPKYDEMEFEQFEVLNPDAECYDSLNS